jgi:hypothetical protein
LLLLAWFSRLHLGAALPALADETVAAAAVHRRDLVAAMPILATAEPAVDAPVDAHDRRRDVVRHSRYLIFQLAEVAVPRQLFSALVERIGELQLACASG